MTTAFDAPLNESLRDAMLALYLHEAIPNDPYLVDQGLAQQIKTANDLYEFWLLDVLVSQNVPTSPVACAIASLQQLVNGIMLNMEPGYSDDSLNPLQTKTWRDGLNRYPIWAATQQLHYFPDIYLDPTLRATKTASFEQLENDLNQAQIQPDTVQAAVLAYLGRFEEIANLKICNGYIDGEDFANSTYYFIAKSPAENAYYWRSLDMRQRPVKEPASTLGEMPAKYDKPLPNAWSDWQKANVPISEKALEHTIRPCWFNNRLFVIWAELEIQDADALASPPAGQADNAIKAFPKFKLYASYKKYDDNWSAPRVYIESYCQTAALIAKTPEQIAAETQTIAVYDHSTSPESIVLMLYSNYESGSDTSGDTDKYDFLRTIRIDKNFIVTPLFPAEGQVGQGKFASAQALEADDKSRKHVLLIGHLFANTHQNAGRFQYWLPSGTPVFGAVTQSTPHKDKASWNFNDWQSRIKTIERNIDIVYDRNNSNIGLTLRLENSFSSYRVLSISIKDRTDTTKELIKITLIFNPADNPNDWVQLLPGSTIEPVGTDFMDQPNAAFTFKGTPDLLRTLIVDKGSIYQFTVPATKKGESASLAGKVANGWILYHLMKDVDAFFETLWRFTTSVSELPLHPPATRKATGDLGYGYQLFVGHPLDVQSAEFPQDLNQLRPIYTSGIVDNLYTLFATPVRFSIDQTTHQPDGWGVEWPEDETNLKIPLVYGVLIYDRNTNYSTLQGGALKALTIGWGEEIGAEVQIAPSINSLINPSIGDSPSLGKAQFIDFTGSSIELSESQNPGFANRAPIRMNTTFARQLIELAENGMEPLLRWETQTQQTEPPIPNGLGAQSMDFGGAYYQIFLELFLYLPWLVAYRLNEEQQYEEAKQWLSYIFDPARQSADSGHPGYWQAVPLLEPVWPGAPDPSQAILFPDDPHQIALSFPVHFRKALYGLYIDIESNQADRAYQELTPDGLAEAKLRYAHILDLLGPRPDVRQVDDWLPIDLNELSSAKNEELRDFEKHLISAQQQRLDHPPMHIGKDLASQAAPLLCLRPYGDDSSLPGVDNPYLRRPINPELAQRWERAESRKYNLQHNLDMAGNPLHLPLFAAPLDPRALLAAWGQGLSGAALSRLLNPQIPHYRFTFMFALAQNAVDSVIQFGSTLLSLIERKEQAQYLELQQQQAWNLAKVAVEIQVQAGKIDEKNKAALQASQAVIGGRVSYYETLVSDGVSDLEVAAGAAHYLGASAQVSASGVQVTAENLKAAPNIIGFSIGGQRIEAPAYAVMAGMQATSTALFADGQMMDRIEQYRRRSQEWAQALDQSKLELKQIEAQLAVYEEQHKATQLQLRQAQTALNQAKATHDFLLSSNRFSRSQTYDWLNSQFAGFYNGAYTTALSMCQAAEACWQYEMGDFTQTFIRPGAWNATYRGLGAGEALKMSLQRMHADYLKHNKRELEIRKTVSLKELLAKDPSSIVNKSWEDIKKALTTNGTCEFELTQKMFDDDYAGQNHFMRRIKTISLTLPVSLGPYKDICAVLTQTYSKVEMTSTVGNAKENLRASQQVALSHGIDDNGLFQLNFQDERYLPFEYTGAISCWALTFTCPEAWEALFKSLTDIIVHISYTARSEGRSL
ncbi:MULTISPECIES: neuraminidase-like domain-containing protein [Pseudomonas]|uniref:Tc toxin subunit A-related protein n=1 Tax=Pseudomonas TaxID=286 RepID=UPI001B3266B0|nr:MULTISPECIES: neuraminidase-like domain-containing protein [Pseudomonas]MBP5967454.1 efflux RND transporter periplasmic adaptor subunit [Pseudomonas iridis]UHC82085.1 efflux RND transporter periplasmic adaptor subunit [Pseudomonas sp. NIBR-H-19]